VAVEESVDPLINVNTKFIEENKKNFKNMEKKDGDLIPKMRGTKDYKKCTNYILNTVMPMSQIFRKYSSS
jgi:hypothetical protein